MLLPIFTVITSNPENPPVMVLTLDIVPVTVITSAPTPPKI